MPGRNFHIQEDVYMFLMKEKNKSKLINSLLRKHYRMEGDEDG